MHADANQRMLLQIATDALPIGQHGDTMLVQMIAGPDARAHQQRRRVQRARRDDDLVPLDAFALTVAAQVHCDRPPAIELDILDQTAGQNVQVAPQPRRPVEVTQGRRNAVAIDVVLRKREAAVPEFGMAIVEIANAVLGEGRAESQGEAAPITGKRAMNWDRSFLAVIRAAEIQVTLKLAQEWQAIRVRPAARAQRLPLVVIRRQAADCDLAVHRRAAAHHPRLLVPARLHQARHLGDAVVADRVHIGLDVGPIVIVLEVVRQERQLIDLVGNVLGRRIRPRFEQGHLAISLGRKAISENATCRTAADDDVIIDHEGASPFAVRPRAPQDAGFTRFRLPALSPWSRLPHRTATSGRRSHRGFRGLRQSATLSTLVEGETSSLDA